MCVIVYKPREIPVDMEVLEECWDSNSNGAGLMFSEDGQLKIVKGFMKWKALKQYIKSVGIDRFTDLPVVFHFRIATHGSVTEENTHPFQINDELAMAHNGVISKMNKHITKDDDISDSEMFAKRFVQDAFSSIGVANLQRGKPINELFAEYIGTGNKLVFMDNEGDIAIINELAGTWAKAGLGEGMWFSNMHWKPYSGSITYDKDCRVVTKWEGGKKITKRYNRKSGALISTTIDPTSKPLSPLGSGKGAGFGFGTYIGGAAKTPNNGHSSPLIDRLNEQDDDDTWYCYECHGYFSYKDKERSYWTNGMKTLLVECPECGGSGTIRADSILSDDFPVDDVDLWICFDCDASFWEDETDSVTTAVGDERMRCIYCNNSNTFTEEEESVVDKIGPAYFDAPLLERGNEHAEK
jgi:hypothetical protein